MWIQFLRLWKSFHKRNYDKLRIRQSWEEKGRLAFLLRGNEINADEVLRAFNSHARNGCAVVAPDMGLPLLGAHGLGIILFRYFDWLHSKISAEHHSPL
jgi:hypothetical protein